MNTKTSIAPAGLDAASQINAWTASIHEKMKATLLASIPEEMLDVMSAQSLDALLNGARSKRFRIVNEYMLGDDPRVPPEFKGKSGHYSVEVPVEGYDPMKDPDTVFGMIHKAQTEEVETFVKRTVYEMYNNHERGMSDPSGIPGMNGSPRRMVNNAITEMMQQNAAGILQAGIVSLFAPVMQQIITEMANGRRF